MKIALIAVLLSIISSAGFATIEIKNPVSFVLQQNGAATACFILVNNADTPVSGKLSLEVDSGQIGDVETSFSLGPHGFEILKVPVSVDEKADCAILKCSYGAAEAKITIGRGIELTQFNWKRWHTSREMPDNFLVSTLDFDDSLWQSFRIPSLWQKLEITWCRLKVVIPENWKSKKLTLIMGAIDDADITFFNGVEIGRTSAWDQRREYNIPNSLVNWGGENIIAVRVDNLQAGGGLYKPPFMLVAGNPKIDMPDSLSRSSVSRPKSGKIGSPLPFRKMRVSNGVLRYPEGTEVALWGVNIYPHSWHQFQNISKLNLDFKEVIKRDFDDLQEIGIDVIRIHVFDREITDSKGNIVENIHLDLLDFIVSECDKRGIYLYLTPISWWGSPNQRNDSFSALTSKPGVILFPESKDAAANYLKQFLTRKNPYTNRSYKDEPCICLFEIVNEPAYYLYSDLNDNAYSSQGEKEDVLQKSKERLNQIWKEWLKENGLPDNSYSFEIFRYQALRSFISQMVNAIRSTGAYQPIAFSTYGINGQDIAKAIADSECEVITVSSYPGGWKQVNDGYNLLPKLPPMKLDEIFASKARVAYEFDAPATNVSCYLYPAIAAHFRSGDVQIACQFQYDTFATAKWNTDWNAHWLNWFYTPSKIVSYMIGGKAFRSLPRSIVYQNPEKELQIGSLKSTFLENNSIWVDDSALMHSRTISGDKSIKYPKNPETIIACGNSNYVEYTGSGLYKLKALNNVEYLLTINPNSSLIGNSFKSGFDSPVAELDYSRQFFSLKIPGWENAKCFSLAQGEKRLLQKTADGWLLTPGKYLLVKE